MSILPYFSQTAIDIPTVDSILNDRYTVEQFAAAHLTTKPEWVNWMGGISQRLENNTFKPKPGVFWVPNPILKPSDEDKASVSWKVGRFASTQSVVAFSTNFAEIDTGTREEQAQRIVDAIAAGMPVPSGIAHSGNKSFHLFHSYHTEQDVAVRKEWTRIQEAMIQVLGGDPSIKNPDRRMRYGCNHNRQLGPFSQGTEADRRDQRVCWVGKKVSFEEMQAWASTIVPAVKTSSLGSSGKGNSNPNKSASDWSGVASPVSGFSNLREFASTVKPGNKAPCICPFHTDSSASAFVGCTDGGTNFVFCSTEGVTFWDDVPRRAPAPRPSTDPKWGNHTIYLQEDLVAGKYLPVFQPTHRIVGLRAPMGTGKTTFMKAVVDVLAKRGTNPVLVVTHRRSLARDLARRLGLRCYLNDNNSVEKEIPLTGRGVVCSLDSLHRVKTTVTDEDGLPSPIPCVTFLDESEQLYSHFFSSTMDGLESLRAYQALKSVVSESKMVVLADAHLSEFSLNEVLEARDATLSDVDFREADLASPWQYQITNDKAAQTARVMAAWNAGQRLAIPMAASADVGTMAKMLEEARPTAKVLAVHSSVMMTDAVKTFLKDPNSESSKYDAILYSPSIGSGVSIDLENHFDAILPFFYQGTLRASDCLQMVHRVRNPKSKTITMWIPKGGYRASTDLKEIHDQLVGLINTTAKEIIRRGDKVVDVNEFAVGQRLRGVDGKMRLAPLDASHFELYVRALQAERIGGGPGGDLVEGMENLLSDMRLTTPWETLADAIDPAARKVVNSLRKEARVGCETEAAEAIYNAEDIGIAAAQEIREVTTVEEMRSVKKAHHKDFFGETLHTVDSVREDLKGELSEATRRFGRTVLGATAEGQTALLNLDAKGFEDNKATAKIRVRLLASLAARRVLREYGITDIMSHTTQITVDQARLATRKIIQARGALEPLGITIRSNSHDEPFRILSDVLKKLGVKLQTFRKRIGKTPAGDPIKAYTHAEIDQGTQSKMRDLSVRYRARLMGDEGSILSTDSSTQLSVLDTKMEEFFLALYAA